MDTKDCSTKIRSKIPLPNTEDYKRGTQSEVSPDLISKPKSLRTAVVRPFKPDADTLDEHASSSAVPVSRSAEPSKVGIVKRESFKRPVTSKQSPDEKTSVLPTKYKAHSGIPFVSSPKKRTGPNPFNARGKQQDLSLRKGLLSNRNATSKLPEAGKATLDKKVPSKEDKSTALERNPKPEKVVKKLADVINPILKEAPIPTKSYAAHSGISFKKKQRTAVTNPFIAVSSTKEPTKP